MIVPDAKPTLNPYLAMTSEKYLKEVTVGPVSAMSGKIVLEEYDAAWKGIFEEEKEKIGRALGRNGIVTEHVGSTSVLGAGYRYVRLAAAAQIHLFPHRHYPSVRNAV